MLEGRVDATGARVPGYARRGAVLRFQKGDSYEFRKALPSLVLASRSWERDRPVMNCLEEGMKAGVLSPVW